MEKFSPEKWPLGTQCVKRIRYSAKCSRRPINIAIPRGHYNQFEWYARHIAFVKKYSILYTWLISYLHEINKSSKHQRRLEKINESKKKLIKNLIKLHKNYTKNKFYSMRKTRRETKKNPVFTEPKLILIIKFPRFSLSLFLTMIIALKFFLNCVTDGYRYCWIFTFHFCSQIFVCKRTDLINFCGCLFSLFFFIAIIIITYYYRCCCCYC